MNPTLPRPRRRSHGAFLSAKLGLLLAFLAPLVELPAAEAVAPVPTELRSDKLVMTSTDTETTAVATSNVILTGTNLRITCDELTIVALRVGGDDKGAAIPAVEKVKYILATGNVRIVQGQRESTSQKAEVFPREEKVVLSGGPVVIDHDTGMIGTGEPLVLLRGQRTLLGTNVKITAPPIDDLGADAKPRAPAAK